MSSDMFHNHVIKPCRVSFLKALQHQDCIPLSPEPHLRPKVQLHRHSDRIQTSIHTILLHSELITCYGKLLVKQFCCLTYCGLHILTLDKEVKGKRNVCILVFHTQQSICENEKSLYALMLQSYPLSGNTLSLLS